MVVRKIGVEIEMEFEEAQDLYDTQVFAKQKGWGVVRDGSLRRVGFEAVSRPLSSCKAIKDTKEILEHYRGYGVEPTDRTSIHIHFGVNGMATDQVLSFLTQWYLIEDWFVKTKAGPTRWGNHHCLTLTQSPYILMYFFAEGVLISDDVKYSAMNFAPYKDSLHIDVPCTCELRCLPLEIDSKVLSSITTAMVKMRRRALSTDADSLLRNVSGIGMKGLFKGILPDEWLDELGQEPPWDVIDILQLHGVVKE